MLNIILNFNEFIITIIKILHLSRIFLIFNLNNQEEFKKKFNHQSYKLFQFQKLSHLY